jgi:hypothetical protein
MEVIAFKVKEGYIMAAHRKLKIGDTIENLKIIEFTGIKPKGVKQLKFCLCECLLCGSKIEIPVVYVGKVYKSCGCLQKASREKVIKSGTVFNRLTVLEKTEDKKHGCYVYKCKCSCDGKEVLVRSDFLRSGDVKSCGCIHNELLRKNVTKAYKNNFVFDTNILKLKSHKLQRNNTSGMTGVTFHKGTRKWYTSIGFQGKKYSLGYYDVDKISEAAKAYKIAKQELHGNFIEWYNKEYNKQ